MATLFSRISEMTAAGIYPSVVPFVVKAMQRNPLTSLFTFGPAMVGDSAQKIEWTEDNYDALTAVLNTAYTAGSGTIVLTAGTADFVVAGDVISIRGHVDTAGRQPKYSVSSNSSGTLTVVYIAGTGADTSFATTGTSIDIDRAVSDEAAAGTGKASQPGVTTNYLQTFQVDVNLGNKALGKVRLGQVKGFEDRLLDTAITNKIMHLLGFIDTAILRGIAQAETGSVPARMAGLDAQIFTTGTGNVVNAGGTTLDEGELNTLVQQLIQQNAMASGNYVLITSVAQSRRLGALRYAKTTYDSLEATGSELGGTVTRFNSEVAGVRMDVVWHPRMEDNRILLVNRDMVQIIPTANIRDDMGGRVESVPELAGLAEMAGSTDGWAWMVNSTTPGTDGIKLTMRAELSLQVKQATRYHGVVRGLIP